MSFSKIIYNGTTLMDVTGDTVTASVLESGYTAHDASGTQITGTGSGGGGSWSWMGQNPTLVHSFNSEHILLKDSPVATWTWSTSQTTLAAATTYTEITVDNTHDYIQVFRLHTHFDYGNWTPMSAITDYGCSAVSTAVRSPGSLAAAQAATYDTLAAGITNLDQRFYYYDSSGNLSYTNASYGVYANSLSGATVNNRTSATPGIVWRKPALYVRGYGSYWSSTAFSNLDMNNSYYDITCQIWSVDAGTNFSGYTKNDAVSIINHGV